MPPFTLAELMLVAGAVAVGSLIQASLGFGFVLVAGPVVAFIEPLSLPGLFILLGIPLQIWMLLRERASIDRPGLVQMMGGQVVGTVAAFGVLSVVAAETLGVLIGASILLAALLSWRVHGFEPGLASRVGAGGISGLMSTVAAVGGPAVALVYRDRDAREVRATLAAVFLGGSVLSLIAVQASGLMEWWHLRLAVLLLPAQVIGAALSTPLIHRLPPDRLRTGVLWLAAVGGAAVLLKGLI